MKLSADLAIFLFWLLVFLPQLDATNPWKATGYNGASLYDTASRLTTWQTKDTVTGTQKYNYPFSYDTSGNRTSDWLNTSYTPNNLNEIVSRTDLGGTTYPLGYDFNGNRTSDSGPTYEWNGADELSAYNFGNYRYEFSYNGDGHLWQAVKKVGGVVQNTYRYLWIGDQVREQRDSTGTTVLQKYWHNGTIINNGTQLLALRDQLGSVRELINNTSALTIRARYRYPEPYGGFPVKVSGDLDSPFQFAGYFIEPFSNLTFTGHRVYVASQGRWLNRDPLAEDGGLNLYGYVGNSPVNLTDPQGLEISYANHPVVPGVSHSKIVITPQNQNRWKNDPRFPNVDKNGNHFATLGAGPDKGWELDGSLNRERDVNKPRNNCKDLDIPSKYNSEDEAISALLSALDNYNQHSPLPYALFPMADSGGFYNSNGFVSGILSATGFTPPDSGSFSPGYNFPVPPQNFSP